MSDFFEPPPPPPSPPEPTRYRMPPWFGAPSGTLPGVVPVELVVVQTPAVAICVTRIAAYPTGFEFDVVTLAAAGHDNLDPWLFEQDRQRGRAEGTVPPELLRFGLQFADGSKVTSIAGF